MRGISALCRVTLKVNSAIAGDSSAHALGVLRRLYASEAASGAKGPPQTEAAIAANNQPSTGPAGPPKAAWSDVPPVARNLGFAGAIPFIALSPAVAAALPLMPADLVANAALLQVGYGASILSFLGGIHWAMAMADYGGKALSAATNTERYIWSVTPCLMAWPAVNLPAGPGALIIAATLGIAYGVDRTFTQKGLLPPWYLKLRWPLTLAGASGMLLTVFTALPAADPPKKK